jgi:formylglycine-generating enzyme required for sulfatase activity
MAKISQKQYEEYRRACRSGYRGMNAPDYGYEDVGFRLALVPVR